MEVVPKRYIRPQQVEIICMFSVKTRIREDATASLKNWKWLLLFGAALSSKAFL